MKALSLMSDEQLATEYADGNEKAFDLLMQRTRAGVFSYIIYIVHNEEVANDLFQETFLKALTKLQNRQYSPTGKFNAWLIRIAHNAVMDWYRRRRTRAVVSPGNDIDIEQMGDEAALHETSLEDALANAQVLNDVKSIMACLPDNQREVVHMRYYQNYSFKEIASITGVSINTSLGRMRYALINMRRLAKQHNIQLQIV